MGVIGLKVYWNMMITFLAVSFIILNLLNVYTSVTIMSPTLIETKKIEDLKTIYDLNELLKTTYTRGVEIESPKIRLGNGFEVTVNMFSQSSSYMLQGDRLWYSKYSSGKCIEMKCVKINEKILDKVSRKVRYLWNE
jgi:hypothetical protein